MVSLLVVLSKEELERFFVPIRILKHRDALMVCYGSGSRVAKAASLKVGDIDSKPMLLRVERGKGAKEPLQRSIPAPARCLTRLLEATEADGVSVSRAHTRPPKVKA